MTVNIGAHWASRSIPNTLKRIQYSIHEKLKNKCRFKHSQYDKILKLTSPNSVKAKIERTGLKYVRTNTLDLFQDSDNEEGESKAPQFEISTIRPSNYWSDSKYRKHLRRGYKLHKKALSG